MRLGLQIPRFHWGGAPGQLADTLARIARTADEAGFASIWVMDHFFQIASIGRPEEEMLEAVHNCDDPRRLYCTACFSGKYPMVNDDVESAAAAITAPF